VANPCRTSVANRCGPELIGHKDSHTMPLHPREEVLDGPMRAPAGPRGRVALKNRGEDPVDAQLARLPSADNAESTDSRSTLLSSSCMTAEMASRLSAGISQPLHWQSSHRWSRSSVNIFWARSCGVFDRARRTFAPPHEGHMT